jgi:hypothetical protein
MMVIDQLELDLLRRLVIEPARLSESDIRDADFAPGQGRDCFAEISAIYEEYRPSEIDPGMLMSRLGGNGGATFVGSLYEGNVKLGLEFFKNTLAEIREVRLTKKMGSVIARQAEAGKKLDFEEIREDLRLYDSLRSTRDPNQALKTGSELQAMDIKVEYDVDKLAPCRSLINLYGPSGLGKTWCALGLSKAVSEGTPFLGLATKQRPVVYVDFENPLPMLIERIQKLDIRDVRFWHLSADPRPPRLDGPDWGLYKTFPAGTLLVFDTLRASHEGDENSSQDAERVMSRLKEIRELGHAIIVIHHTTKVDGRVYKGSSAWVDLADHTLSLHRVKKNTLEEIDDTGFDPGALLALGTGLKTRFEPFRMFLTLDAATGDFQLAGDPSQEELDTLRVFLAGTPGGATQTDVSRWAKDNLEIAGKGKIIALLKKGEGRLWRSEISGRSRYYVAI